MKKNISIDMMFPIWKVVLYTAISIIYFILAGYGLTKAAYTSGNDISFIWFILTLIVSYRGICLIWCDWTRPYLLCKFGISEIIKVNCTQVDYDKEYHDMFGFVHHATFWLFDSTYKYSQKFLNTFKSELNYEVNGVYNNNNYVVMKRRKYHKNIKINKNESCYLIRTGSIIHVFGTNEYNLKNKVQGTT